MNWLLLLRLGIVGIVFLLGWQARAVTIPLLAAYLLMLVCLPWRQRWKKRLGNVGATLACMAMLLILPLVFLMPIVLEFDQVKGMLPKEGLTEAQQDAMVEWTEKHLRAPIRDLVASLPESMREPLEGVPQSELIAKVGPSIEGLLSSLGKSIFGFFGGMLGILSSLVLLPIFLFYLLEGAPWLPRIRAELPTSWKGSFDRTMPKIQNLLRTYCRARLLVAAAKGAIAFAILLLFGVPGAYTLGLMVGAFSLLPVVGALVSSIVMLGFCVGSDWGGFGVFIAIGVYAVTEVLEGYVLLPRLVGRELGMSDFVVILALLFGGALMGFFGLLISIPAVAVAQVLLAEYVRPLMRDPEPEAQTPPNKSGDDGPLPAPVD
jgi:predicted PurR-regulated permease PerM